MAPISDQNRTEPMYVLENAGVPRTRERSGRVDEPLQVPGVSPTWSLSRGPVKNV